jgi:hypothetical protein
MWLIVPAVYTAHMRACLQCGGLCSRHAAGSLLLAVPCGVRITGVCLGFHVREVAIYAPGDQAWHVTTNRHFHAQLLGARSLLDDW